MDNNKEFENEKLTVNETYEETYVPGDEFWNNDSNDNNKKDVDSLDGNDDVVKEDGIMGKK